MTDFDIQTLIKDVQDRISLSETHASTASGVQQQLRQRLNHELYIQEVRLGFLLSVPQANG